MGGSYRQLLGTAEMILHMRDDMNVVEDKLGRVGKGCGRGVVGGMAGGLAKLQERGKGGKRGEELEWAARIKVLDMCAVIVGRLLKKGSLEGGRGKSLVLAAKVLVLSRLLSKSITDMAGKRSSEDKERADAVKRKVDNSRKRLVRAIEKNLERIGGDNREELLHALSAYSLTKSSGARDVLRRFLEVRGDAMALAFEDERHKQKTPGYERALRLYAQTLLDVQALVPRRLSEALASLKAKHLLKDESLRQLEGLRLDVCENCLGEEILYFTPYIRHDDLDGSFTVDMLKGWAKSASKLLLGRLGQTLEIMIDFKSVVDLRTKMLEIWIKEGGKARGFDSSILLGGLRKVVNDRLVELLISRVSKLHLVSTEVEGTLGTWREGVTDQQDSLWGEDMIETEVANGAGIFKLNILARTHGRNDAVSRAFRGYQTWRRLVDEVVAVIEQLKKQRWDDDLEDIEDDLALESRNTLLSVDDPQMLQDHLDTSLGEAYTTLHDKVATLMKTYEDSEHAGQMSIYILRIVRHIRSELPVNTSVQTFGLSLIPTLHKRLVSITTQELLFRFSKSFRRKTVAGRALWEGPDEEPELPVQPSPGTFKFLHSLALAMAKTGSDLWSPKAVTVLKLYVRSEMGRRWLFTLNEKTEVMTNSALMNGVPSAAKERFAVNGEENAKEMHLDDQVKAEASTDGDDMNEVKTNGNAEPKTTTQHVEDLQDQTKDVLIQSLFDTLMLLQAFGLSEISTDDELVDLGQELKKRTKLEAGSRKRLESAAKEYWKRTSLLFGLLAQTNTY